MIQKENIGMFSSKLNNMHRRCPESLKVNMKGVCVSSESFFYLGYSAALWSRLAEIGIRTTFIVFTSISSLLFEALDERIENIAKKAQIDKKYSQQEMAAELNELRCHYDLVCRLIEQINRSFGFVLLLITGHDFVIAIMDFNNILDYLDIGKGWFKDEVPLVHIPGQKISKEKYKSVDFFFDPLFEYKFIFLRGNPFKICQFAHPILRYVVLLVVSHRVGSKVPHFIFFSNTFLLF